MIRRALSWLEGVFSDASDFAEMENHIAGLETRIASLVRQVVEKNQEEELLQRAVDAARELDRRVIFTPDPKIARAQEDLRTALAALPKRD